LTIREIIGIFKTKNEAEKVAKIGFSARSINSEKYY